MKSKDENEDSENYYFKKQNKKERLFAKRG